MNGKNKTQINKTKNEFNKYQSYEKNRIKYIEQIIRKEIQNDFKNNKNIYIYDKLSKKYNIIEIFIILLSNSEYNKRDIDITFLLIIKEDYPKSPPLVFCLTAFNKYLDIFDVRNIQENLIINWPSSNSNSYSNLTNLILNLPILIDNIDTQISFKLLPDIGKYYINSFHYDLNDFFMNTNNKFFRVKIAELNYKDNGEKDIGEIDGDKFIDMFLIFTKNNLIFLKSCYDDKKNICKIKYLINLTEIKKLKNYNIKSKDKTDIENLSCFKIVVDEKINKKNFKIINNLIIAVDKNNLILSEINELISERKEKIYKKFKFFEKNEKNGINEIEKIIEIKKSLIQNKRQENIFNQIHELYNKLIEISSNKEGEEFSKYVKDFQNFVETYENMNDNKKNEQEKEIIIDSKNNIDNNIDIDNNNINDNNKVTNVKENSNHDKVKKKKKDSNYKKKKSKYNFGFE